MNQSKNRISKAKLTLWIIIGVLLVAILGAYIFIQTSAMGPLADAQAAMKSTDQVKVTSEKKWIEFMPANPEGVSVIFYQGGLVEEESYAPLAQLLSEAGHPVYISRMLANLAVTKMNLASEIQEAHPEQTFVIGGHSLGGAMTARYAASHTEELAGVFFLGAYPDEKGSIDESGLPVISITGTKDEVVNREKLEEGRNFVPQDAIYYSLDGGNHAQFGDYGLQKGDGTADITSQEQQRLTAESLIAWMGQIDLSARESE
ncbi:alpha/beta hydrolase [Neobacillus mesonae]|nr:alpha/beta hydrolase [Neobacillus mesonae]